MHNCENCKSCGGCHPGQLELSAGEVGMLQSLGQFGFLPVARKADDMTPIYREDTDFSESDYSLIIRLLEKKASVKPRPVRTAPAAPAAEAVVEPPAAE